MKKSLVREVNSITLDFDTGKSLTFFRDDHGKKEYKMFMPAETKIYKRYYPFEIRFDDSKKSLKIHLFKCKLKGKDKYVIETVYGG